MKETGYDVVVIGGALSGASAAILLRREHPDLSVLVVEKAERFDAKVGEATTEMSAMFLTRRLALWEHLEREHLPKEGLRYWSHNEWVTGHGDASEAGAWYRSAVPSFQLRRDVLDEHLLATAASEGAEVMRPARVREIDLGEFDHRLTIEQNGEVSAVRCRWVLDASGRVRFLGRKLGLIERNADHPVAAIWGRWRNVRHIDDLAARQYPELAKGNVGSRRLATNHYIGRGYWIWVIPLGNGETSIGVVFDRRLIDLHESRDRQADFVAFLRRDPSLRELLEGAELRAEDLRFYSYLPYIANQYMGEGWALLGDAAAFLDPYYSPGLDHACFTVEGTVEIIGRHAKGEDVGAAIDEHNAAFARSYRRFFESIYRDMYYHMGEHDLVAAAVLLDTAHYYIFVVIPAYRFFRRFHWLPVLGPKGAFFSYHLMRIYHRRFKAIANLRVATGEAGRRNRGRRISLWFNLRYAPLQMAARGLRIWLVAEIDAVRLEIRRALGVTSAVPADRSTTEASS